MADIIQNGGKIATAQQVAAALAAPRPVDRMLAAARPRTTRRTTRRTAPKASSSRSTATSSRTTAAAKTTSKAPIGRVVVTAAQATVFTGGSKPKALATVTKNAELPFFRETSTWYNVEATIAQRKVTGWIRKKDVRKVGAPAPKAAPPKAAAKWVTVTAEEAKIQFRQKDGKYTVVGILKKGERARVLKTTESYYWVEATAGGKKVVGWLSKKRAK